MLSSGDAWAHLDMERQDQRSPSHRYYRHVLSRTIDGRVFQLGPFKDLEYERHRDERPFWLGSQPSWSTSS